MAITNYETSWEGMTGLDVETFIKDKLQSNENAANALTQNGVVRIEAAYKNAGQPDEDQTTIVIKGYNAAGTAVTTSEFSTITQASYTQHINELDRDYSISSIINKGQDLSIPYDYYILDENDTKVAGYSANVRINILCGGNKKTINTTTYRSTKSSVVSLGYFTIPAEFLGVGTNIIEITAITTVGAKQTSVYVREEPVYVADLKLNVAVQDGIANPRSVASDIRFNFSVSDSNGGVIPQADANGNPITVKKRVYISKIGPQYLSSHANNITGNYVYGTFAQYLNSTVYFNTANPASQPLVTFYLQAYIESDEQEFVSNTVMVQMICLEGAQTSPDTAYVAMQLNDVEVLQSIPYTRSKQYAKVNYNFYAYSVNASTYEISTQAEGESSVLRASGNILASTVTPIEYSIIYRESGDTTVSFPSLSFVNRVSALNSGMEEPTGATLNLVSSEKAAGSADPTWVDGDTTCVFNGFDWISSGWVNTDEGTALAINNGAVLTINYAPFDRTKYLYNTYPYTISFRYKITNGSDESEELIKCLVSGTGFVMKPQYVGLYTSASISQNISNDEVHEITLVYYGNGDDSGLYKGLQAIYIDGTIQAIAEAGAFVPHTSSIEISASTASIYLYSVKAYRRALSFTEIQSLFCFNQSDTEKIASYVNENDVFKTNTTSIGDYGQSLDRTKLPKDSVVLVLYGREDNPRPWETINAYEKRDELKSLKHALSAMHLYVAGYTAHPANFYAVGGTLSAQGTSSMAYPVKNFRIYLNKVADAGPVSAQGNNIGSILAFYQGDSENPLPANFNPEGYDSAALSSLDKSKLNKKGTYREANYSIFSKDYLNPDTGIGDSVTSAPANRFCLKADYAESSGVHNTGFARFSNEILKSSTALIATDITSANETSTTPPQQAVVEAGGSAQYKYDVRMNIDGRPIYLFGIAPAHQENGVDVPETEYYLGRYNFNNDKNNVKVFGFEGVKDYENNPIVKAEGKALQMLALQSGIDPHYAETHLAEAEDEEINPTECWEFSSNDGISREMGAFHYDKNTAFTTTLDEADSVDSSVRAVAWLNATWEYRYPDLEDEDGDLYYRRGTSRPYLLTQVYNFLYDNNYSLNPSQTTLNRFADNLHYYFNVNSVVKYFVLTHWFLCLDQRIKNSMLAFWCDPYGVSAEEAAASPMHYMRGYYIFYDNDTILGLDNAGAITNPWDFYETDTGNESLHGSNYNAFPGNGIHGLWTNLQKCYELYRDGREQLSSAYKLGSLVAQAYKNMREKATDQVLESYFSNKFPDAIQNVDLEVKYLNPNQVRPVSEALPLPQHLEMAQGTREFHRANLLKKRTLWLDDLYGATGNSYAMGYKTSATNSSDNGSVVVTINPNFRFWKFFISQASSHLYRETPLVTSRDSATLVLQPTDRPSISDFIFFSGLYACKSIDFTNFTWDPTSGIADSTAYGVYPYMEDFKIHPFDGSVTRATSIPWVTPETMPNLKSLVCCNMVPITGDTFGTFGLRTGTTEFAKLESLDLRGTPISEVVFPNSAALKTINLDNPVSVTLVNKPNVTSINIGSTNLNSITVRTSSSAVYGWALTAANAIFGENQKDVTIVFGESAERPYIITSENVGQLTLLNQLAEKVKNGGPTYTQVNITGNIFTTETFDTENIGDVFQNLNITDQLSGDGFTFTWQTDLYEDSIVATSENVDSLNCLVIRSNMDVANWSIKIDGQDGYTLNGRVSIVKTTKQRCYIHANPYDANLQYDGKDHKLVVYAELANGDIFDTYTVTGREIMIYYQPITSVLVSTDTPYVTGVASPIDFTYNPNTKKHLLTSAYVEANPASFISSSTNNATVQWRYDTDGILCGANVNLSGQQDDTITFNILGIRNTISVFYDSELVSSFMALDKTSDKYWMKLLQTALDAHYPMGDSLTKSQASRISLIDTTNFLNQVYSEINAQEVSTPQDFSNLQYFQLGSGTTGVFTVPAVPFTNMTFPVGTTAIMWDSLPNNVNAIRDIIVRSSVKKLVIYLNADSRLENVQIDLSATSITKIGAFGNQLSALDNDVASVSLTFAVTAYQGTRPDTPLFKYPDTLTEIGNTDKTIATIVNQTTPAVLMFNLRPSGGESQITMGNANAHKAPYYLSGFKNPVKAGAICSFRSSGSAFGSDWSKITNVAYSFVYDNEALISDGVFALPSVITVGDYALYHDTMYQRLSDQGINEVRLNGAITSIGTQAFSRANYVIRTNNDPTHVPAVFNSVTSIGAAAFYMPATQQSLRFSSNLRSVGGNAFTSQNVDFDVYIDKTDALQDVEPNSFGDTNSRTIIHVPADSALYTQLTAQGMDCRNRVQTL